MWANKSVVQKELRDWRCSQMRGSPAVPVGRMHASPEVLVYAKFFSEHRKTVSSCVSRRISGPCQAALLTETAGGSALQELQQIVQAENEDICYPIPASLIELASDSPLAAAGLLEDPVQQLQLADQGALFAQQRLLASHIPESAGDPGCARGASCLNDRNSPFIPPPPCGRL